jgi:signal transduction histidine kinase
MCDLTPDRSALLSSDPARTVALALEFVRRGVCPEHAETALGALLLVTDELVTNAVRHGRPPVTVHLSCQTDAVRLAVGDAGARFPDEPGASGGLGLEIVAKATREWGITSLAVGKQVWCRVPTGVLRARVPQRRSDLLAQRS